MTAEQAAQSTDHYSLLQVHPRASEPIIHAAYRVMAAQYPPHEPENGEICRRLNEAKETLLDPVKRLEYDKRSYFLFKQKTEYEIEAKIGEGGFGKTYKGTHLLTKSAACLKHCSRIS